MDHYHHHHACSFTRIRADAMFLPRRYTLPLLQLQENVALVVV